MTTAGTSHASSGIAIQHILVRYPTDRGDLEGTLSIPSNAVGVVLFAHGSGSTHTSPRNRFVADILNDSGLATLLIDLLTGDEQQVDYQTAHLRFNIPFLSTRLVGITDWLYKQPDVQHKPVGIFGASTGAAAALVTAAKRTEKVRAVVSRGGRPDLALEALETVLAPTLLIVGGEDTQVIELNRRALAHLHCHHELAIVPGATHLFEEHGALARVAALARDWFRQWLPLAESSGTD